jgi:hypothetical protein
MKALLTIILALLTSIQTVPTFKAAQAKDEDFMGEIDEGPIEVMPGCSWYCGGFVSGFNSSSTLPTYKDIIYSANKAHDFDITTAWIEGKTDYGVGEFLEYSFDMTTAGEHQLGITKIILANGYKKTKKTWEENSRVKKLKMYVDNKPFGQLELLDSFEFQTIDLGKIMLPQQKVMKFKFEIVEIYPGTKYKDTAISELLFEGVGVH